ncbi:hypothetical protein ABZ686_12180, partial [Streptomyces sp. NPDC006992]|uniref:hypothetical protein n=1 Tax=Streptomyces sp. NPDC006992 TaxID=3155601 RepID=UPI0033CB7C2D
MGRVDLDAGRAHIVEAYVEDNGKLYLDTPKNHEPRTFVTVCRRSRQTVLAFGADGGQVGGPALAS